MRKIKDKLPDVYDRIIIEDRKGGLDTYTFRRLWMEVGAEPARKVRELIVDLTMRGQL